MAYILYLFEEDRLNILTNKETFKRNAMDVLQQFITQSAIGPYSPWIRNLVFSIFLSIVLTLAGMLAVLLLHGQQMTLSFGY